MAKILKNHQNREFNGKRINDIFNYVTSLNTLTNVNCKSIAIRNPIAVTNGYEQLIELKKELDVVKINIKDINIHNVFNSTSGKNEAERFISNLQDGVILATERNNYRRMKDMQSLDEIFSYNERVKRKNELELEIDKKLQTIEKLERINPSLAKSEQATIKTLQLEFNSLVETLDYPLEEEIRLSLYSRAVNYIEHLKLMVETKIDYLSNLVEELN